MRVLQLPDQQTPGPGPDRQRVRLEQRGPLRSCSALPAGGAPPIFGNLLTLPVADGLIYVEPVYAVRAGSTSGYPILQYVLVSYGGEVGIGRTLGESLADALNVTGGGSPAPSTSGGNQGGGKGGNSTRPAPSAPRSARCSTAPTGPSARPMRRCATGTPSPTPRRSRRPQ